MQKRLITLLITGTLLSGFFVNNSFAASQSLATAIAERRNVPEIRTFDGIVEAVNQATVSAQISGRVEEVNFDVDDLVEKGAVLVRVRDAAFKAKLHNAEAALLESEANLKRAQQEHERIAGLYKEKAVSTAQFDQAKTTLNAAEARVAASKATIKEAKEQLDNTVIKAPYGGIVSERHVQLGETIQPGQKIMSGFALNQLRINTNVPQTIINSIRTHSNAQVYLPEHDAINVEGNKITIFPYADAISHNFQIRVNLPEDTSGIFPGMLVKIGFITGKREALLVPTSSVVHRSEVSAVYVVSQSGAINFRQVRVGRTILDSIEILAGVDEGETIALDPVRAVTLLKNPKD